MTADTDFKAELDRILGTLAILRAVAREGRGKRDATNYLYQILEIVEGILPPGMETDGILKAIEQGDYKLVPVDAWEAQSAAARQWSLLVFYLVYKSSASLPEDSSDLLWKLMEFDDIAGELRDEENYLWDQIRLAAEVELKAAQEVEDA